MTQSYPRKPYTRKPLTPFEQLQAAIARVQKGLQEGKDYRVAGKGKRLDTGETFYCVPSDSEKLRGLWHVLTVKGNGSLDCDCYFSREKHQVCTHRATVYLFLKDHPQAPEKQEPPSPQRIAPAPTIKPTKENALPYDHAGEAFSIFKPERDPYIEERRAAILTKGAQARRFEDDDGNYIPGDYYQHAYR